MNIVIKLPGILNLCRSKIVNKTEQTSQLIKKENIDTNINTNINTDINPVVNSTTNVELNYDINDIKNSLQQLPEQLPEQNAKKIEEIEHIKLYSDVIENNDNTKETNNIDININDNAQIKEEINQQNMYAKQSQSDLEQILQQQNGQQISNTNQITTRV